MHIKNMIALLESKIPPVALTTISADLSVNERLIFLAKILTIQEIATNYLAKNPTAVSDFNHQNTLLRQYHIDVALRASFDAVFFTLFHPDSISLREIGEALNKENVVSDLQRNFLKSLDEARKHLFNQKASTLIIQEKKSRNDILREHLNYINVVYATLMNELMTLENMDRSQLIQDQSKSFFSFEEQKKLSELQRTADRLLFEAWLLFSASKIASGESIARKTVAEEFNHDVASIDQYRGEIQLTSDEMCQRNAIWQKESFMHHSFFMVKLGRLSKDSLTPSSERKGLPNYIAGPK